MMLLSAAVLFSALVGYPLAEQSSWEDVRLSAAETGKSQLSVHVPLNLPGADALVYSDCAFNAWKLPVPAGLKMRDSADDARIAALRVGHLGVCVGVDPYLPDYRQTKWTRRAGGLPIVKGTFEAIHRFYTFEYCTDPVSGELYVRGTVKNVGFEKGKGVVRFRRAEPLESDILDYHYVGFRWDAAKWSVPGVCPPPVCAEIAGGTATVENGWCVTGTNAYGRVNGFWGSPYTPEKQMRLPSGGPALKLEAELAPGEEFSFTVAAGFAPTKGPHLAFDAVCAAAERFWARHLTVAADFGNERENDIFRTLQYTQRQLLLNGWNDPARRRLQPCQGGTSERFYVWNWEAMSALVPLARLGHAEAVSKVLEYMLEQQDGATPPVGNFTTLAGAIGQTGPRWANSTGAALLLAATYLDYTDDTVFVQRHLAALLKAAKWIVGEIRATRRTGPDGKRIVGWGLLPGCTVNDGDSGIFYATTDTWSYAGLNRFAGVLKHMGRPEADELLAEAACYREAIEAAIDSARRPDGFIGRCVGSDADGSFEFRNIPGAFGCIYAGVIDPASDGRFAEMVRLWESTRARGLFLEPFDANINYAGTAEAGLCRYYMQRAEWKRAYLARETCLASAMTRDLYVTSERYSDVDDSFAPWQPNASNAGRILGMMADRFLLEGFSRTVLLGGFAPFEAGDVSISNLSTAHGTFSLRHAGGRLEAEWGEPLPAGSLIVVPAHHGFCPDGDALERVDAQTWRLVRPSARISGKTRGFGTFIPGRAGVSDTNSFTCGSAPAAVLSVDRTRLFASYLTSRTGYGEAHDIVAIADIPVADPAAATNRVIFQKGETIGGVAVDEVDNYDAFLVDGKMRCILGVNGGLLGWRDWNPETGKVCGEGLFACRAGAGAPVEPLTPAAVTRFLNALGFKGHDMSRTYRDQLIAQSRISSCRTRDAFYGTLTSSKSQPVVYRCTDGKTFEFVGAVPSLCEYECALACVNGRFYALGRKMDGANFFVSDDGCRTFRPAGRIPDGEQRPQLINWRNRLLIGYSAPDESPRRVRNGRNNLHLLLGEGDDLSRYDEILHAVDPLGIVYYSFAPDGDRLHVVWSDASRFPDKVIWGAVQGKDSLFYGQLDF